VLAALKSVAELHALFFLFLSSKYASIRALFVLSRSTGAPVIRALSYKKNLTLRSSLG